MTETQQQNNKLLKMPLLWPARLKLTLFMLLFITIIASCSIILKQKLIQSQIQKYYDYTIDFMGQHGFKLQDIIVSGRLRTTIDDINKILALHRQDNFLNINVMQIKRRLEELPWVRDVTVKRSFFPNILQIKIQEKEVLALWQLNQRFYPLDLDGYVIEAEYKPNQQILLVVGEDAPENILNLLNTIKKIDETYIPRLKVANYISKRRWNLTFDDINNGITVKLPSEDFASVLTKLINLDKTSAILKRKLTIIDLRLPDKMIVKMRKDSSKYNDKPQAL